MNPVKIKLDVDCLKHINLFQQVTKAGVKDCIINLDKVLFVVNSGQAGMAIGKNGVNIKNLQRLINKKIEVVEFSDDLLLFLNNILRPVKVVEVNDASRNGKQVVKASIDLNNEVSPKMIIRSKIKKARPLLKKYFNIDEVIV